MSFIVYIIVLIVTGLFIGALGRLAIPGRDPMSLGQTTLVGIGANIITGLIFWAVFGYYGGAPLIVSIVVAALIVYGIRRSRGGSLGRPSGGGRLRR